MQYAQTSIRIFARYPLKFLTTIEVIFFFFNYIADLRSVKRSGVLSIKIDRCICCMSIGIYNKNVHKEKDGSLNVI